MKIVLHKKFWFIVVLLVVGMLVGLLFWKEGWNHDIKQMTPSQIVALEISAYISGNREILRDIIYFPIYKIIFTIREIIPSIGIAEGIGGEPFTLVGAIIPEQEGIAQFADIRLAGEECIGVFGFTEGGHLDGIVFFRFSSEGCSQNIIEHDPLF